MSQYFEATGCAEPFISLVDGIKEALSVENVKKAVAQFSLGHMESIT